MIYVLYAYLSKNNNNEFLSKYESYVKNYFENNIDIKKYKNWKDVQASLLGRILLNKGLLKLKNNSKKIKINYFENGKPYLLNSNYYFNISHSDNIVLCAIYTKEIGIDIEKIKNINTELLKYFMNENEYNNLLSSNNQSLMFFKYWTRRESLFKTNEKIIFKELNQINLLNDCVQYKNELYYFKSLLFKSIYMLSICTKNEQFAFKKIILKRYYWNSQIKENNIL
jgi:4'-phosphopantetheinyl transferase